MIEKNKFQDIQDFFIKTTKDVLCRYAAVNAAAPCGDALCATLTRNTNWYHRWLHWPPECQEEETKGKNTDGEVFCLGK